MTDRTQRMIAMYSRGSTLAEVGEAFGVTAQRVHQLLKDETVLREWRPKISEMQAGLIRDLSALGRNNSEIARAVGVSRPTVIRYLADESLQDRV